MFDIRVPLVVALVVDVEEGAAVLVAAVAAVDHLVAAFVERDAEAVVARKVFVGALKFSTEYFFDFNLFKTEFPIVWD